MDSKRHFHSGLTFKIEKADNESFVASITQHDRRAKQDDEGALYYVVVVILIYACSILMMIASYIRKNKVDRRMNRYFKEMASVRKRESQLQLFNAAAVAAALQNSENNACDKPAGDNTASSRSSQGQSKKGTGDGDGGEARPASGKAVLVRQESIVLPARTVSSSTSSASSLRGNRTLTRNSVRFVNEQSDIESDNDVFVSEGQATLSTAIQSPVSPKPSPLSSPYLTPKLRVSKTAIPPDQPPEEAQESPQLSTLSEDDATSPATDTDTGDTEHSPLMGQCSDTRLLIPDSAESSLLPPLPEASQRRRSSACKLDYQVVSTV